MKESIDSIIDTLAAKLPLMLDHVRDDRTWISGKELLLGGFKTFHGKPIDPVGTYEMEVPVVKGELIHGEVIPKTIDHKKLMAQAWLRKGLPGLYEYLSHYLTADQLAQVKTYFMKRQ